MLVVVQHSGEFVPELHLGSVAVDAFFILSSFLLTWLFMKKSMKLLAQGAGVRAWTFTLADYFQKRFFRVYPLFAITAFVLWRLPPEDQQRYIIVGNPSEVSLLKMLTFDFPQRYFVFWTVSIAAGGSTHLSISCCSREERFGWPGEIHEEKISMRATAEMK
ncbi:hypothetical protein PHYSODRAFT_246318 [Phytophthora sojae]|uniref:Acyltransferase 3 domain-containing protein n=1 Tax=Phytophthora sojae (strain P6497) TaxID=1094619 RepID=G4YJ15_PHYSP|nr:hypothetical protein PHYSODRAFT_246318 [Phytophthora sojae]EGZ29155.1 hypothetical protein PHYSODRAFT_246318 [Phytophthora sojae]|eukprot:XP_009516430.1 hypothetical protein PHYSODRAFT_246318 [Phytophthora sojae]